MKDEGMIKRAANVQRSTPKAFASRQSNTERRMQKDALPGDAAERRPYH